MSKKQPSSPPARVDGGLSGSPSRSFPIRTELKSDRVAGELGRRILVGELEAGDPIPTEHELCEMFGVSRSVIRDALGRLVARGLVSVRQGHGTTVAETNDTAFALAALALLARSGATVGEVIDARATLETAVIPLAAETGTDEDWRFLRDTYKLFADAVEQGAWQDARDAHLGFHMGLLQAVHQPTLQLLLRPMTEVIWMSSDPPRMTVPADWEVESHWPIVVALEQRDAAAVERAVHAHYTILEDKDRYGDYRSKPFRTAFELPALSDLLLLR